MCCNILFFSWFWCRGLTIRVKTLHDLFSTGFAAGSKHSDTGNGANTLCLTNDPEYNPDYIQSQTSTSARLFAIEYRGVGLDYENAPCALCWTSRDAAVMIPARRTCPAGWTLEYEGLLMAERETGEKSEFVCVSLGMETIADGTGRSSGGFWFQTEAVCLNSLNVPCPPYEQDNSLSCVVCSK